MDYLNKRSVKQLNDLDIIKEQWKIMTQRYFKLLEREKKSVSSNSKANKDIEKTSCPSG